MINEPYKFTPIGLGAYLVDTSAFEDHRGYFMEGYSKELFAKNGIKSEFVQYNASSTKYGGLRGFHFQKEPSNQARFFRCMRGKIFDAAVDVRKGSPTFGQHITATISAENRKGLYIPKGFANAVLGISEEDAAILYLVDNYYSAENETGLLWNDPALGIEWPMTPTLISKKDQMWPVLKDLKL